MAAIANRKLIIASRETFRPQGLTPRAYRGTSLISNCHALGSYSRMRTGSGEEVALFAQRPLSHPLLPPCRRLPRSEHRLCRGDTCVYTYTYIYTYIYIYVYMCIYIYIHICIESSPGLTLTAARATGGGTPVGRAFYRAGGPLSHTRTDDCA